MIFRETSLAGSFVIGLEPMTDSRGFFARGWCEDEYRAHGLISRVAQTNLSFNARKGTLRGLHYQAPPFEEARTLRCIRGEAFAVIVDIRPESPTFREYFSLTISADNRLALYVPPRFALGFQTLSDDVEFLYLMSETYDPGFARGIRWDDPSIGIAWPDDDRTILERDATYPDFDTGTIAKLERALA